MATATANQIILQITAAMKLGAETHGLEKKYVTYVQQLIDSDAASIRALAIKAPLKSTRAAGSRDEDSYEFEPSGKKSPRLNPGQRDRLRLAFQNGTSIKALAVRFRKSEPTIRRQLQELGVVPCARKRLDDSAIDEMVSAYKNRTPVEALAAQFRLSINGIYYYLRKREVPTQHLYPKKRKAAQREP